MDILALLLSDVRYGLGAYLGVYLMTEHGWNAEDIGFALSFGGLTGLIVQGPLGVLVDRIRAKRYLLAAGVMVVTATCLFIPLAPRFLPVALCGVVGALAGTTIEPLLATISLGIVGPVRFARRACRNECLFHLSNGIVNVLILLLAPLFGSPVLFWAMGSTAVTSVVAVLAVPENAIDHAQARGLLPTASTPLAVGPLRQVLESQPLVMFALCGALFHLANGAMLGLVAQKLALAHPGQGIALTAASAIAAQAVMVPAAVLAGWQADAWGRKPLLLVAFAALALRAMLYAAVSDPAWIIFGQLLDGVSAGLLGALFPVVIADLTRGSGCFCGVRGVVATAHGLGGVVSGLLGGWMVVQAGYGMAFLVLGLAATTGGALFWIAMPETADRAATIFAPTTADSERRVDIAPAPGF